MKLRVVVDCRERTEMARFLVMRRISRQVFGWEGSAGRKKGEGGPSLFYCVRCGWSLHLKKEWAKLGSTATKLGPVTAGQVGREGSSGHSRNRPANPGDIGQHDVLVLTILLQQYALFTPYIFSLPFCLEGLTNSLQSRWTFQHYLGTHTRGLYQRDR